MSDFPEASDWWKASDERWYAPPSIADGTPPATISTPAEARSADREAAEKKAGRGCLLGLALVFVLIVAFLMSSSGGGSDSDPAPTGPTMAGAEDVCIQAVKGQLKAPAGASVEVQGQSVSGSRYTLTGVVDSENSFGANVRANWACTATHVSGSSWRTNVTVAG